MCIWLFLDEVEHFLNVLSKAGIGHKLPDPFGYAQSAVADKEFERRAFRENWDPSPFYPVMGNFF